MTASLAAPDPIDDELEVLAAWVPLAAFMPHAGADGARFERPMHARLPRRLAN